MKKFMEKHWKLWYILGFLVAFVFIYTLMGSPSS